MANASPSLLSDIERHCNNYFNPQNDPNSQVRDYPAAFLELAGRIAEYTEKTPKTHITNAVFGIQSQAHDLEYTSWQYAFRRELSIYTRMRTV